MPRRDPRTRMRRAASVANLLAAAIGVAGLAGGAIGVAPLLTFGTDFPILVLPSALALVVAAGALHSVQHGRTGPALAAAAFLALLTIGSLAAHATGRAFGLDFAWFPHRQSDAAGLIPVHTALACLGLAAGVMLHPMRGRLAEAANRTLAALIAAGAFVALEGLVIRVLLYFAPAPLLGMSLPAAIGVLLLAVSLLAGRPDAWVARVLGDTRPGAVVMRWLMPASLVVPLALSWLQLGAVRAKLLDEPLATGLLVLLITVVLGVLTLWIAAQLDRMDASRREAEEDARTQREHLQVVLESIGDGVIATGRAGEVRFLNRAAEDLTGWMDASAIGRPIGTVLELVDERTEAPVESPLARALAERGPVDAGGEPAVRSRGGALHPVELVAAPLRDEHGGIDGAVLVLRDATMRREGERAMREAYAELDRRVVERTRLLAAITASTPDLIYAQDREGRILLANPAWLKARGLSEAQVLGRRVGELFTDAAHARAADERRVVESGESSVVEEALADPQGARTFLITKSPLRDEHGAIVGLIGVATDITARKHAERELEFLLAREQHLRAEAERANRAKDEFLAIVSHELRSPLNALRGWSHLLASTRPLGSDLVERATAAIKRSVEHQARLIDDLLDTARIISGKLTLEPRQVELREVVSAVLDVMRPIATAKHVTLVSEFEPESVIVLGDGGRLQQVMTNLVSNAVKFTSENGRVEVTLRRAGERAQLAVRDDGIGIAPEFLPHVFDRFTQADTSTTRRAGGLGIGLALVRHLVELHGGTVRAESAGPGQGARFVIELPALAAATVAATARTVESAAPSAALSGRAVYAVDDDVDARETLAFVLREAGARVEMFADARALAARFGQTLGSAHAPDVLLLDLAMPEEDGFAVLARVRAIESAAGIEPEQRTPALAVTAFTEFDRAQLLAAGFDGLVPKPVDRERIVRAILETLERRVSA